MSAPTDAPVATGPGRPAVGTSLRASVRRIVPLAWPVFVGQLAVLAFGTLDTVLVARHATRDLAALAVGGAAYITVFIGLMGTVMAIGPIVGRLYGAGDLPGAGRQMWQALWLALGLAVLGCTLLVFPAPFLALSRAGPELEHKIRLYLLALAASFPAALLYQVFRGFNNAVSRPKVAMLLQLGALALKLPLSLALVGGVPSLGIPAMGVVGCGIGTMIAIWVQAALALLIVWHDPFYRRFALWSRAARRPHGPSLLAMARLGVPMGLSIAVEVTGFVFMAIFIARIGETAVAGHQIAANLVSLLFMLPLGLSTGASTLVAQRIGAGDLADARRLGWHGLQFALGLALLIGGGVYALREAVVGLYTPNPQVAAATLPLLAWVVLFHAADAAQMLAASVLRAWHVAVLPVVIYVLAIWGVGLGGGNWLAFAGGAAQAAAAGALPGLADAAAQVPTDWHGARGFWIASTTGLSLAALALCGLMGYVSWRRSREDATAQPVH